MDRQLYVDRLLESENLTDHLEDKEANALLDWGIAHIDGLINGAPGADEAGDKVNRLMAVMRGLNSLAGDPRRVTPDALVDLLGRYKQLVGGTAQVDENEVRSLIERVATAAPGQALAHLIECLDQKKG